MRINKNILAVALAVLLPMAALQAQTYRDTLRTNTWSVYGYGGLAGFHGMRGVSSDAGVRSAITPDFAVGVKYNIKPWVRIGFNLGYVPLRALNTNAVTSTVTQKGVTVGSYSDGVSTIQTSTIGDNHYQHLVGRDLNVDFNLLSKIRNGRWNMWAGTGIGYLGGWDRGVTTTVTSEEVVALGDDHYNVYNHDMVNTDTAKEHIDALYIPVRLSVEYDLNPLWTIGAKGEYKWLPCDIKYTPVGIWSAGVTLAYNFVGKTYSRKAIAAGYRSQINDINDQLAKALKDNDDLAAANGRLKGDLTKTQNDLDKALAELDALKKAPKVVENTNVSVIPVFFTLNRTNIRRSQEGAVATAAELLTKYPDAKLIIKGYASIEGPARHNVDLANLRAYAVREMLVNEYGIDPERISSQGCGATDKLFKEFDKNRVSILSVEK